MAKRDKKTDLDRHATTTVESLPKAAAKKLKQAADANVTLTSAPHAATGLPKADTKPVSPVMIAAPIANDIQIPSMVVADAKMHRDRRAQNENRRGRFAEKTPAGTRTKMLKIIYDRRADMLARKKSRRRFQIIGALITAIVVSGGIYQGTVALKEQLAPLVQHAELWWEKVVTPAPGVQQRADVSQQQMSANQTSVKTSRPVKPVVRSNYSVKKPKKTSKTSVKSAQRTSIRR